MSAEVEFAPSGFSTLEEPARPAGNIAATALRFGSLIAFGVILIVFSLTAPYFLSIGNIGNVLGQSAISGVLAIGLTIVLIAGGSNVVTGGIDLSLAANMGLSAAVYASLTQLGFGDVTAILASILTGTLIGAVNAIAVVYAGIVPLLATLAVMNVVAGLELVLTGNTVLPASTPFLSALSASDSSACRSSPMCSSASRRLRRRSCNIRRLVCAFTLSASFRMPRAPLAFRFVACLPAHSSPAAYLAASPASSRFPT